MSDTRILRWQGGELVALEYCDTTATTVEAADSWLVEDGLTLAITLHRDRFLAAVQTRGGNVDDAAEFFFAALQAIPERGTWFPRVELQQNGAAQFYVLRLRTAPERQRGVVVTAWGGPDVRIAPRTKGPDLEAMLRIRTAVQPAGAGEAVLLTDDGYVVEGAYSGLLWWRGGILCGPPADFDRIDSVSARSILGLAAATGTDTWEEAVRPSELEGVELWAVSALHGIRVVTEWIDGPTLAELPGRADAWRARLKALRQPLSVGSRA